MSTKALLRFPQFCHNNNRQVPFICHPDDDHEDSWVLVTPAIKGVTFVTTRDLKADYMPLNQEACKLVEKVFEVNPIAGTVKVAGFDFCEDKTWDLKEFKQMCFENNWEGTLAKVEAVELATEDYVLSVFYGPRYQEVMEAMNTIGRQLTEEERAGIFQRLYPDDWQKYCVKEEGAPDVLS